MKQEVKALSVELGNAASVDLNCSLCTHLTASKVARGVKRVDKKVHGEKGGKMGVTENMEEVIRWSNGSFEAV